MLGFSLCKVVLEGNHPVELQNYIRPNGLSTHHPDAKGKSLPTKSLTGHCVRVFLPLNFPPLVNTYALLNVKLEGNSFYKVLLAHSSLPYILPS